MGSDRNLALGDPVTAPNTQHHIHHNRVTANKGDGINLWQSSGCKLDHNECDNNGRFGIYLQSSPNCAVDNNQSDNNDDTGILVGVSPNCAVTGNEANNNVSWGITVWESCGSSFERNVAEGNGQGDLNSSEIDSACYSMQKNRADTASPSLDFWGVK